MLALFILAESQRKTGPVLFMILSAGAFILGISILVFRRHAIRWGARVYPGNIYDENTPVGKRTVVISYAIVPILMCIIALYGFIYAASEIW